MSSIHRRHCDGLMREVWDIERDINTREGWKGTAYWEIAGSFNNIHAVDRALAAKNNEKRLMQQQIADMKSRYEKGVRDAFANRTLKFVIKEEDEKGRFMYLSNDGNYWVEI